MSRLKKIAGRIGGEEDLFLNNFLNNYKFLSFVSPENLVAYTITKDPTSKKHESTYIGIYIFRNKNEYICFAVWQEKSGTVSGELYRSILDHPVQVFSLIKATVPRHIFEMVKTQMEDELLKKMPPAEAPDWRPSETIPEDFYL